MIRADEGYAGGDKLQFLRVDRLPAKQHLGSGEDAGIRKLEPFQLAVGTTDIIAFDFDPESGEWVVCHYDYSGGGDPSRVKPYVRYLRDVVASVNSLASSVSIGRSANNAVVTKGRLSSRKHAVVTFTGDGVIIEDVGSKNGTDIKTGTDIKAGREYNGDLKTVPPFNN